MTKRIKYTEYIDAATVALDRHIAFVMTRVGEKLRASLSIAECEAGHAFEYDSKMGTACFSHHLTSDRWLTFYATPFFEHTDGIATDVCIDGESVADDMPVIEYGVTFDVETDADEYIRAVLPTWNQTVTNYWREFQK